MPASTTVKCEKCSASVSVALPMARARSKVHLYGGEAERPLVGRHVFVYSMVGCDFKVEAEIAGECNSVKAQVCPDLNPASWRLHMMDAWDMRRRKKHLAFGREDFLGGRGLAERLFELLESVADRLFIFSSVSRYLPSRNQGRQLMYTATIASLVEGFTQIEAQPILVFDSDNDGAEERFGTWAEAHLKDLRRTLLYPFLANGIPIPDPKFVAPGSHPFLELADFVSFVVARALHRRFWRKAVELDPDRLGRVTWLMDRKDGNLIERRGVLFSETELGEI